MFKLLGNYEERFGECHNKLRLVLDLLTVSYKLSFVFVSDGSLSEKLKADVLVPAGQARAVAISEKNGLAGPYILDRHGPSTNILKVIEVFTENLLVEEKTFSKVWDPHFVKGDKTGLTGLYHFSEKMSQIIENDLSQKLEDLDFDKDPYQITGELVAALLKFDEISKRNTLNVIKPKLEQWLSIKLVSIRELVARGILFETWTPISDVSHLNLSNTRPK